MDRIIITEQDLSSNAITEEQITDVVFIPGFASMYKATDPVKAGVPTFCSSVADFEAHFGTIPAQFNENQYYPSGDNGFAADAIPSGINENKDENGTLWFSAGDNDIAYIYAKEILYSGLPIIYYRMNEETAYTKNKNGEDTTTKNPEYDATIAKAYETFEKIFTNNDLTNGYSLFDKGELQFKYITTGGYPVFEYGGNKIYLAMCQLAADRGDCVALIDHTDNHERPLQGTVEGVKSVYKSISDYALPESCDTYGTMITPWSTFKLAGAYSSHNLYETSKEMPGSFAYIKCLGQMLNADASWLAVAGVTRGLIPNFMGACTVDPLTNRIADSYQPEPNSTGAGVAINAITNVKPYGYCIWGNRTLRNATQYRTGFALNFLNIRNLISDVKKQAYVAAKSLMFEQNNDVLWLNFKSLLTPLLDQMVSGEGLSSYKIVKNTSQDKTRLSATIRLYPKYAIESFEIAITLEDEEVTVE